MYRGAKAALLREPSKEGGASVHHGADGLGDTQFSDSPDISLIKSETAPNALCRLAREHTGTFVYIEFRVDLQYVVVYFSCQ